MSTPLFLDCMVDVETVGTNPEVNGMIQLSAVKFDLATKSVQPFPEFFNRCLKLPPNRYWDEGTRQWWNKKTDVYRQITARAEDPALVMKDFVDWVGLNNPSPVRFWAKPTTFDWSFIASYLRQYDLPQPFHYRYACDLNSFIRGLAKDATLESHYVPFKGDAHNAIFDVLHQIDSLFQAVDKYGNH